MSEEQKTETPETSATVHVLQDPLPESNFFYRRWFSYVVAVVNVLGMAFLIHKMTEEESLRTAFYVLGVIHWFTITYYMIAPSAEQLARIIQAARIAKTQATGHYSGGDPYNTPWGTPGGPGGYSGASYDQYSNDDDYGPRSRY